MWNEAIGSLLFYLLSTVSIGLALGVVGARRILRAAVALMGVLAVSAGFYLLLGAEFLAGVQVLVYVGGIVVLLVFAVMLTRSSELLEDRPSVLSRLLGVLASGAFFGTSVIALRSEEFGAGVDAALPANDTVELGRKLLDYGSKGYALPFEMISLLLLAAMIGGIVIARKGDGHA